MFVQTCGIILSFLLMFTSNIFAAGVPNPVNVLTNSGFENGFNAWTELYGYPSTLSNVRASGNFSAKKTINVLSNQDYYSTIYQDMYFNVSRGAYPAGTRVYCSAYAKTEINPITKSTAGIQMQFLNSSNQILDVKGDKIGGITNWRYLYASGLTPFETAKVRISGYEFARLSDSLLGGNAYFDDFMCSMSPIPLSARKTNLLNNGFENGINDWNEGSHPSDIDTTIKHSGNLGISHGLTSPNHYGTVSQTIDVSPSDRYRFSGWVASVVNSATNATLGIHVKYLDANGAQVGPLLYRMINGGFNNWTQLTIDGVAPAGALKAEFSFFVFGFQSIPGDRVYFDDALIIRN